MNAMSPNASLVIGLVNNMPATARRAADQQFTAALLGAGRPLEIRRFAATPAAHHAPIDALWDTQLHGLIVTGAEPRADRIEHEPCWPLLARVVDWAAEHTQSAIWSCLAAHAATHRLDRLPRRRLTTKLSGVFACTRVARDPVLDGAPDLWDVPHSRHNDLDADQLRRTGYTILSRCGPSVDAFARTVGRSRFLMLQGHPEYAADTLLREYRRDLTRSLAGDRDDWPPPPERYFPAETDAQLARAGRTPAALATLDTAPIPPATWQPHAARLFAAWLGTLTPHPANLSI